MGCRVAHGAKIRRFDANVTLPSLLYRELPLQEESIVQPLNGSGAFYSVREPRSTASADMGPN